MTVLGYCWPQSVEAGDDVTLHLAGDETSVAIDVVRDGAEPETVWRSEPVQVERRDMPELAPEDGCGWAPTVTISVDPEWPSGMYIVRVGDDPPSAWFVVRSATPTPGTPLLKLATNTWNAYNDVGGRNLYSGAVHASPLRPLGAGFLTKPTGTGERVVDDVEDFLNFSIDAELSLWHGMSGWAAQERRFVVWAERSGITLDYAIDADLDGDRGAALLDGRELLLSIGHDEYWTWGMRDQVEGFVADGGNVAFLSGNTAYWQVRLEAGPNGEPDTRMAAFKHRYREDPVLGTAEEHLITSMWADPLTTRPEAAMTGVSFTRGGYHRVHRSAPAGAAGYEVHRADHWLLRGTDLERGDLLGTEHRVVGYECDGTELTFVDGLPTAVGSGGTPANFTVVATAPATAFDQFTTPLPIVEGCEYELEFHAQRLLGDDSPENCDRLRFGHAVLGTWSHDGGGRVVTVGCTDWAYGLDDPTVSRITRTILRELGGVTGASISSSIDNLEIVWASVIELCDGLTDEQWSLATGCPGWTVQDQISHLVDYEANALGRSRPDHAMAAPGNTKNPLGEMNEVGVDARRALTGAAVLAEFREVVDERIAQLRTLVPEDLDRPIETPAGPGTLADMLRLRVMDTWSHEQDIRRAIAQPGHESGPVVAESLAYFTQFLPFVVGKRAKAPDGASVVFDIDGVHRVVVEVSDGRARLVESAAAAAEGATAELAIPVASFVALVGGRDDAPDDVVITGDVELGAAVVAGLAFMP